MSTLLLSTDLQQSVMRGQPTEPRAYSPYGNVKTPPIPGLAFCGQYRDSLAGNYPLGNGHRSYRPALMRFTSPDSLSPFYRGGINAYAYCHNDPVNFTDPSGRFIQYAAPVRSILSGVLNLGITAYKYLKDMRITKRYFSYDPEFAASRNGDLATGTIESELPRLDWRQKMLMGVGGSTALASIGTGVARLAGANNDALVMADFSFGAAATISSAVEVGQLAVEQLGSRYPIKSAQGNIQFPASGRSSLREPEWPFSTGVTPPPSTAPRHRSLSQMDVINERQTAVRETAV